MNDLEAQVLIQLRSIARWQAMNYTHSRFCALDDVDKACNAPELLELLNQFSVSDLLPTSGNVLSRFFRTDAFEFLIAMSASPHWLWVLVAGAARNKLPISKSDVDRAVAVVRQDLLCVVQSLSSRTGQFSVYELAHLIGLGAILLIRDAGVEGETTMLVNPMVKDALVRAPDFTEFTLPSNMVQINLVTNGF
ncbi:hypothetical protein BH10CYA1_BH10CYA1_17660 [soil metagenome]